MFSFCLARCVERFSTKPICNYAAFALSKSIEGYRQIIKVLKHNYNQARIKQLAQQIEHVTPTDNGCQFINEEQFLFRPTPPNSFT